MLIDLVSSDNLGHYNITLAQLFGLQAAVYIDELINITSKAIRKKKEDNGYITLDRQYVENRTTLSVEEQIEIDKLLMDAGILEKSASGRLNLNLLLLSNIMCSDSETLNKDLSSYIKAHKKPSKKTKEESICEKLCLSISTQNEELREAYREWIQSVIAKEGWMSATAVSVGELLVDKFADHNLDVALTVVRIASINGYRDMQWAINTFNANYKVKYVDSKPAVNYNNDEVVEIF